MEKLLNSSVRIGNFTSSGIVALLSEPAAKKKTEGEIFGAAAKTYIEEANMERRLNRSLSMDTNARPTAWGNFVEGIAFELLGTEYKISSQESFIHPDIPYWGGSPDGYKFDEGKTVFDLKCPYTLTSFCKLVQPLYEGLTGIDAMNAIRENHKDGEKYYWQLVSNSIIGECKFAELIVYVPYLSELEGIRDATNNFDGNQNKVAFINFATDEELPYIFSNGYYKNLNVIRFEVPEQDKLLLTARVLAAGKQLITML